jgi:uncharacterized protein YsxB (DUF464 family)
MVNVTIATEGKILSLRLEGHAGYAEVGKDIVCASASILAYTVAQFVMEAENKGDLASPPHIQLDSGDTLISCEPCEDTYEAVLNAYLFAKMGYALLAHNYPQYVELITDGEAE